MGDIPPLAYLEINKLAKNLCDYLTLGEFSFVNLIGIIIAVLAVTSSLALVWAILKYVAVRVKSSFSRGNV